MTAPSPPAGLPPWFERRVPVGLRPFALRLRPWFGVIAFLGGFLFDALTLRRVDDLRSNVRLAVLLVVGAGLLILERRAWHGRAVPAFFGRHEGLLRYGLQFCYGGLFNAYLIFYYQSATAGPSLVFCLLIAALILANEVWFDRLRPDVPQVAMWFFCILSFLLFAIPTWTGELDNRARIAAAVFAFLLSTGIVIAIHFGRITEAEPRAQALPLPQALSRHAATWLGMLAGLVGMITIGAVPPVPLALTQAGVFHSIALNGMRYDATYDPPPWWAPWREDDRVFQLHPGDSVICFTAVFAPNNTSMAMVHAWEHRAASGEWVEVERLPWTMRGGRDGGWRSYTEKHNVAPGDWRVRVLGEQGWEIGRVAFEVIPASGPAPLRRHRLL